MQDNFVYYEDIILNSVIENIKDFFYSRKDLHHNYIGNPKVTKINFPWKHLKEYLEPSLKNYMHIDKFQPCGGNIYKHTNHYTTHVDDTDGGPGININIPLDCSHLDYTSLVIFDQYTKPGLAKTWDCKPHSKFWDDNNQIQLDLEFNHRSLDRPFDDPLVMNKTTQNIDINFFETHLKYKDHEQWMFKGLTGNAVKLKPGDMLVFPSNQLHSTGYKNYEWKLGIAMMFKGTMEELVK